MLQIGICDDSELDRAMLRECLGGLPNFRRAGDLRFTEYSSAEQLLFRIENNPGGLDVLFLDIYMPGLNGMETARKLRMLGMKLPIIFLTTSPDFAVESYDVGAIGYLLKPVKQEKLASLMEKLRDFRMVPRLAVKCAGRRQYCEYGELLYLESCNNVTILHLIDGQELRCSERLNELEKLLQDKRFLRCHQSYLVNMDYIRSVENDFILCNGARVPIRVRSHKELTDLYYNYFVANSVSKLPEMGDINV